MRRVLFVDSLLRSAQASAFVAVIVGSAAVAPRDARACSCGDPGLYAPVPSNGAVDVVRNPHVFRAEEGDLVTAAQFVHDEGGAIDAVVTHIEAGDTSVYAFAPVSLLEPNRHYEVQTDSRWGPHFTTGTAIDDEPPPLPEVRLTSTWSTRLVTSSCGPGSLHGASFEVTSIGEAPVVLVHRGASPSAFDGTFSGEVTRVLSRDAIIELGSGGCAGGWPTATGGAEESFSFALIDRAGHFSGWSDPVDVVLPSTVPAFACTHTIARAQRPTSALALLAVLALVRRRLSPR